MKLFNLLVKAFACAFDMVGIFDEAGWTKNSFESGLAFDQFTRHQIATIAIEQIENEVNDLSFATQIFDATLAADAWLQKLKARHAVLIERHDFTIQDCFFSVNLLCDVLELWIILSHLKLVSRHKSCCSIIDKTD